MCGHCVIESVRERMLSRRDIFRTATAAGAVAAAAGVVSAPAPAHAAAFSRAADMTHTLTEDFPTYFGAQQFWMEKKFDFAKDGFNLFELKVNEHTGTHIDSPMHFSAEGTSVDLIPVSSLVAPICVLDIKAKAAESADAQLTPDDVKAWTDAHGPIPEGACVAMNSGWAAKIGTEAFRGFDGAAQHYPGFHVEAAEMLMDRLDGKIEAGAGSIAVDTLSLDFGMSPDFVTHYKWLPSGRFGIECIAGLDDVPATGATLVVGAPKHAGGSGGPARIFALV